MRRNMTSAQVSAPTTMPKGWIILGLALVSWVVVAAMVGGMTQMFSLVSAAL